MPMYLIIGNIFSFLAAFCTAVSVVKKSKKDLVYWQIGEALFGIITNAILSAFAALVIGILCLSLNILSYKNLLTKKLTIILLTISIFIGLSVNNLAIIGLLPIIASANYTICIYITKSAQQMRWALAINMILWFIHNLYVQAYPSAIVGITLCGWTLIQIFRHRK